ncbi:MAG: CBS domain-containing protein [Methanosphaera sp.]|nr:CBS domain-containing protein [Methanosphaera sp.]
MNIEDVMSEGIITIRKDQTISDALKLMEKHKISRLPAISSKDDELVGIITEKDIATKIASSKYEDVPLSHMRVSTIMTRDVITAKPGDSTISVLKTMIEKHIGGIPIIKDGTIIGMVTKTDFLKNVESEPYTTTPIKDIMTPRVVTVNPDDRLVHARRLMIDKEIDRLVVVDSGLIMGIITAKDMAKTLIDFKKRVPEKYQENQIRNLFVQEVMSQTIETTTKDTSIADVANIMVEKEFSGIPISENNKIQGIVSKTDILKFVYDHNRKRGNY